MTENVKRYRLEGEPQEAEMIEDKRGGFVKYEDYERLLIQLAKSPNEKRGSLRFHPLKGHIIE
jgi:hypothetical protein